MIAFNVPPLVAEGERHPRRNSYASKKHALSSRDGGARCRYCGVRQKLRELTVDHVVPLARGGTNARTNLVLACQPCNQAKGNSVWVGVLGWA